MSNAAANMRAPGFASASIMPYAKYGVVNSSDGISAEVRFLSIPKSSGSQERSAPADKISAVL
jgi:hypothetical protein